MKKKLNLFVLLTSFFCVQNLLAQEICNNGIDDDGDGLIDCYDQSCFTSASCPAFQYASTCPPSSPIGELLGVTSSFISETATGSVNFTIPAGTENIRVTLYGSNTQFNGTTNDQLRWHDEDFIQTLAFISVPSGISFGLQAYIASTNPSGAQRTIRAWRNCPNGNSIATALIAPNLSGLPAGAQEFSFTVSGSTLSILPTSSTAYKPDYTVLVEFYSGNNNSLNLVKVVNEHIAWYENSRYAYYIPPSVDKIFVNVKGVDFLVNDYDNYLQGREEGYISGRIILNRTNNRKTGIFNCINGSSPQKRSNYQVSNQFANNAAYLHTIGTGDVAADNPGTAGFSEASLYHARIYIQGDSLIIEQGPDFQFEFETNYLVEMYGTVAVPTQSKISVESIGHNKNSTTNSWFTRNVTIPPGTQYIEIRQNAVGSNIVADNNENPLETYAFINLITEKAHGFFNQQVNTDNASTFTFNNLPLNGLPTSGSTVLNEIGVYSEGHNGTLGNDYDLAFDIYSIPGMLRISNRYGMVPNDYEMAGIAIFYGTNVDVSMPSPASQLVTSTGICTYQVSNLYCNQGGNPIQSNFPISYYNGNPFTNTNAMLLGTFQLGQDIEVGQCITLNHNFNFLNYNGTSMDIYPVLGDNGSEVSGGVGTTIGTPLLSNNLVQTNGGFTDCNMANNLQNIVLSPSCSPLPVELTDFKVEKCERKTCLSWNTQSENNSWYFRVLKSPDYQNWEAIDTIDAAGNSSSLKTYSTIDEKPFSGDNYYKLEQYDLDGTLKAIRFAFVDFQDEFDFKVFPNPFESKVTIQSVDKLEHLVQILDINGREVFQDYFKNNIMIETFDFDSGCYFVVIDHVSHSKILKN